MQSGDRFFTNLQARDGRSGYQSETSRAPKGAQRLPKLMLRLSDVSVAGRKHFSSVILGKAAIFGIGEAKIFA